MPANIKKREPAIERRAQRQAKRKRERAPMPCRILVVCEGEKTEPNYFNSFITTPNKSFVYDVEALGFGLNTIGVVKKAIELRDEDLSHSLTPYDAVWAVFDKDSFPPHDFDNAIALAKANNIGAAWSNEAFELWYLLHFEFRNTAMSRDDYKDAISAAVNSSGKWSGEGRYVYKKNDKQSYDIMNSCGSQSLAIKNAKALRGMFSDSACHSHNPSTTVDKLISQLLNEDTDLIDEVMKKINAPQ